LGVIFTLSSVQLSLKHYKYREVLRNSQVPLFSGGSPNLLD